MEGLASVLYPRGETAGRLEQYFLRDPIPAVQRNGGVRGDSGECLLTLFNYLII